MVQNYFKLFLQKMTFVILSFYSNFLPTIFVDKVVKATMLMELKGINIAATTGSNLPVTAKESPIQLYKNESKKLQFTIFMADLVVLI